MLDIKKANEELVKKGFNPDDNGEAFALSVSYDLGLDPNSNLYKEIMEYNKSNDIDNDDIIAYDVSDKDGETTLCVIVSNDDKNHYFFVGSIEEFDKKCGD